MMITLALNGLIDFCVSFHFVSLLIRVKAWAIFRICLQQLIKPRTQTKVVLLLYQEPFPANNLKKYNKNAKPNKDIFLYPKI